MPRGRRARATTRTVASSAPEPRAAGLVRAARIERGLSQAELARAVGLTRQALYAIESNIYLPNVTVALRLAHRLGRRVEDLFSLDTAAAGATVDGELLGGAARAPGSPRADGWPLRDPAFAPPVVRPAGGPCG